MNEKREYNFGSENDSSSSRQVYDDRDINTPNSNISFDDDSNSYDNKVSFNSMIGDKNSLEHSNDNSSEFGEFTDDDKKQIEDVIDFVLGDEYSSDTFTTFNDIKNDVSETEVSLSVSNNDFSQKSFDQVSVNSDIMQDSTDNINSNDDSSLVENLEQQSQDVVMNLESLNDVTNVDSVVDANLSQPVQDAAVTSEPLNNVNTVGPVVNVNLSQPVQDAVVTSEPLNNVNTVGPVVDVNLSQPVQDAVVTSELLNTANINSNLQLVDTNATVDKESVMPNKVLLEESAFGLVNQPVNYNDIIANAIYYDVYTNCFIDANGNQYYNVNVDNANLNNFGINNNNYQQVDSYDNSYKVKIVKKKPSLLHIIVNLISYTLFILLLIIGLVLLFYVVDNKIREAKGDTNPSKYNAYVVLTGSMLPTIGINDVVITQYSDSSELEVGDIVTYFSEYYGVNVTHRIIEKYYDDVNEEYTFRTRGDNNDADDPSLISGSSIYGRVIFRIPKLGYVQNFLANDGGWIIVVLIPCLLVLSYDIMKLFKMVGNKTKVLK